MGFRSFRAEVLEFGKGVNAFVKLCGVGVLLRVPNHALQISSPLISGLTQEDIGPLRILHQSKGGGIHPICQRVMRSFTQLHKFCRRAATSQQQAAIKQHWPNLQDDVTSRRHADRNLN